ncbi:MAG: hypothetical protein IAG10_24335 [Planctomycetaceae bacterium]|nr:hypothetical protein [Planctomycetaceae bacterium]
MAQTPLYRIRDWSDHFETSESRKRVHSLGWVGVPTKHDGKTFRRLMRRTDGVTIYGAWVLILAVAAKCPTRGTLADGDGPLSADDIADMTGAPADAIKTALEVLTGDQIRWIETIESAGTPADAPAVPVTSAEKTCLPDQTIPDHNQTRHNPTRQPAKTPGFEKISDKTLRDTEAVLNRLKPSAIADTEENRVWLIAAAERALNIPAKEVKKSRGAIFVSLAKELATGQTEKLEAYRDAAKLRLRTWKSSQNGESNGQPKSIAEVLAT